MTRKQIKKSDICHELKTHPKPFLALRFGYKNYEFRKDDRDPRFELGHVLILREWDPVTKKYSGEEELRRIGHVMRGSYGMPAGYCVMSWGSSEIGKAKKRGSKK